MGPERSGPSTAVRLSLKPTPCRRGFVDGAWWPRSNNPAPEFASLLTALVTTSGPITRLAYNLTAWKAAPRRLDLDGREVRLEGFHAMDQNTVSLTDPRGNRTVLLLIPATMTERRGNAVLARASSPDNTASPHDLLTEDPRPASAPIPKQAETSPEARWETDGGHLLIERS